MPTASSAAAVAAIPGLGKVAARLTQPPVPQQRLICSIEGHTKTRKSSFGLWGPGPVAVVDTDHRLEHVIVPDGKGGWQFPLTGNVVVPHYVQLPPLDPMSRKKDDAAMKMAAAEWDKYVEFYAVFLESSLTPGGIRTVLMDDITEAYDLRLIAEFGRLQAIQQRDRGGANFDFVKLIDMGKDYRANVVWAAKVKEEWVTIDEIDPQTNQKKPKSMASGNWIPDGYKRLRQTVQVAFRAQVNDRVPQQINSPGVGLVPNPKRYEIEVIASGLNGETNGRRYSAADWGEYGPFAWAAHEQIADTIPEEWQ